MFSDVLRARLPRHFSPHALCRIRGAIVNNSLGDTELANANLANLAGGNSG